MTIIAIDQSNQTNRIEKIQKKYQIEYQSSNCNLIVRTSSSSASLLPSHTLFCLHCLCLCFLHTICSFPTKYIYLYYNVAYQFPCICCTHTHVSLPQHSQKTFLYFLNKQKYQIHLKLYNYRTFQSLLYR